MLLKSAAQEKLYSVKGIRELMGTFVTIVANHPDLYEAKYAVQSAFDEINRVVNLMSVHKFNSEVSSLNKNGFCIDISEDTRYVICRANYFSELSDGAFDITILPILQLWERKRKEGALPADEEICRSLELVNYRNIVLGNSDIKFARYGMNITLAGAAKGYAIDRAIQDLKKNNIKHALVNGGGDIRVNGGKTKDLPWKIRILDPRSAGKVFTTIDLYNKSVATSGTYKRFFNDLISPRDGKPAQEILSSTIITEEAIDSDILATSVIVLGKKESMRMFRELSDVKYLIITRDGDYIKNWQN